MAVPGTVELDLLYSVCLSLANDFDETGMVYVESPLIFLRQRRRSRTRLRA